MPLFQLTGKLHFDGVPGMILMMMMLDMGLNQMSPPRPVPCFVHPAVSFDFNQVGGPPYRVPTRAATSSTRSSLQNFVLYVRELKSHR